MKRRSIVAVASAVAALSLVLAGCSGSSTPAATGADGQALPTVSMMVGGIDKQIYLPYQLAESLGFYKKYGVNMQLSTEQNGGVGAEEAMISGQVNFSGAWYIHAADFQTKGKNVINLVQLSGAPGERLMCSPASNVKTPADLKGKKIGVTDLGSGTDQLSQFVASKGGVTKNDYTTVAVHAGATAIAAVQRGEADCVMTTQPTVATLESQGLATSAIDLATTSGAQQNLGGAWPAAGLLAQADWVDKNKDTVQKVVTALVATMNWIHTHTAQDVADALPQDFVQNSSISKDQYVAALQADYGQFLPDGLMPAGGPKTIFQMETAIGTDVSKVSYASTFTQEYAQAALKQLGITPTTKAADTTNG
ncbi:ABC transporter substrate-binding protein [Subtercola boreus]|uniref:ABC transporter substrate-binding protein n=1 Tax=Subtercola boreus TaxID=120213 RepID=A0A3E0W917_9MICO|nr:ABC transporter substrate-binding protein [Subtercola boreus]RFA18808.1 ABC transporter substrate-binding protein [Subtercola boreus]RFA18922.1 ABC transporter substrate-binding protein [Subtercola boreus]RFA25460.1 ABC transporter substrate-binding protein [Subtercola boreus]